MKTSIQNSVRNFFERYPNATDLGTITDKNEFDALTRKIRKAIPNWYRDLLLEFPIAGLPLGVPNDFGQELFIGRPIAELPLMEIEFFSLAEIVEHSTSYFPFYQMIENNYIGIAMDKFSTQEGVFIDGKSDNPPVRLIFHDMGETNRELIEESEILSPTFSDLFTIGKLCNKRIKLKSTNEASAMALIEEFFALIKNELALVDKAFLDQLSSQDALQNGIAQYESHLSEGDVVDGLLDLENGLYDSGYPLRQIHLDNLKAIYHASGLHLPELAFIEDRVLENERKHSPK